MGDTQGETQSTTLRHWHLTDEIPQRLPVLDDGSYMLEALAGLRRRLPFVAIVEQTTQGLIKIEENAALEECSRSLTVVNVARSRPKIVLEPPFIGAAVIEALGRRVASALDAGRSDRCLILGYGAIGRQVAAFVSRSGGFAPARVSVFDVNEDRMRQA